MYYDYRVSDTATNIQQPKADADIRKMGCLKACVMKRMNVVRVLLTERSVNFDQWF